MTVRIKPIIPKDDGDDGRKPCAGTCGGTVSARYDVCYPCSVKAVKGEIKLVRR